MPLFHNTKLHQHDATPWSITVNQKAQPIS